MRGLLVWWEPFLLQTIDLIFLKEMFENQFEFVKESLISFISSQIPNADISFIDDIVLSYIVSIINEIDEDGDEFDLDVNKNFLQKFLW